MNIVSAWRARDRSLRGRLRRCSACGRYASVRRAVCANCGAPAADAAFEKLPAELPVIGWSHAHLVFEQLDQIEDLRPAVLLELPKDQVWPMPLCESDSAHAKDLVGESVHLELRRSAHAAGANEPIVYMRKAAANPATRAKLNQERLKSKKQEKFS
jgi:uncharacterized OB-fold protein